MPRADQRLAERLLLLAAVALLVWSLLPSPAGTTPPARTELLHRIDINTAAWHELVNLPGIGVAKAVEIINSRENHGPIESEGDLLEVYGVGPVTVSSIREHLREDLR